MTHGWPGSFLEFVKVIGPLSDPESHGAGAEDAFDLVVPSMPGFGFSARPQASGWNPERIASAWAELMRRLGYRRYVSQGGDWGAVVTDVLGRQAPDGLVGIHVTTLLGAIERPPTANTQTAIPPEVAKALKNGEPPPAGLSAEETIAYEASKTFAASGSGFRAIQGTRPQTIGYSLADSPVGLAAWIYEKFTEWTDTDGEPERALTKDEMLDDITLYWLTNTAASSARIYWEDTAHKATIGGAVSIPAAVSRFPREIIPTAQLGRARLPEPRLLQRARQGRSLRRLGTTGAFCGRDASGVQVAALIGAHLKQPGRIEESSHASAWARVTRSSTRPFTAPSTRSFRRR